MSAVSSRLERKTMLELATAITSIRYYKKLAKNETMNTAHYLEFPRGLMNRWHGV